MIRNFDDDCIVCYCKHDIYTLYDCGHFLHKRCLNISPLSNDTIVCPLCRQVIKSKNCLHKLDYNLPEEELFLLYSMILKQVDSN